MNPFKFAIRRPVTTLMLVVALICGGVFGLYKMRVDIPWLNTTKVYAYLDYLGVKAMPARTYVESFFHKHKEEEVHHEEHKLVVTSPKAMDVTITQEYVCQIHSRRHINVRALENGYLEAISVREGQAVKTGDVLFKVVPTLYQARLEAEVAEADFAKQEYLNSQSLQATNAVSSREVLLYKAKLARAEAKKKLAEAELNFATVRAPFDGIVDKLHEQQGSLIKEGDILTTLSDNSVMWVYFNVPERRYLEYMAEQGQGKDSPDIDLVLANHNTFPETGKIGAIEANFNNETGNISFRADFANPILREGSNERLLRHGQTGTIVINRKLQNALVIPQRATFENLAKRYVYVVGKDDVVHQREIAVQNELEDIYVIKDEPASGETTKLGVNDKILLEGIRQVRDGDKVEAEFRDPTVVLLNPKYKAE